MSLKSRHELVAVTAPRYQIANKKKLGYLDLSPEVREKLLTISPATMDRLLFAIRHGRGGRGIGTTQPGGLLKHQIPIRTFADWNDVRPGFIEADLVAHWGTIAGGPHLHTVVFTDVATGWVEFKPLLFRDQDTTVKAIHQLRPQLPFPLLGLDTDNGTEFLNYTLLNYCLKEEITFTRSRSYKKNDQCYVEQKNGSVVRKFVGYDRFEGLTPCQILEALYAVLRLYVNFFQPSVKLPDAFGEIWPTVVEQLEQTPDLQAKELLRVIQRQHPGQFKDSQLRSFQRRIRAWRRQEAMPAATTENGASDKLHQDNGSECRITFVEDK